MGNLSKNPFAFAREGPGEPPDYINDVDISAINPDGTARVVERNKAQLLWGEDEGNTKPQLNASVDTAEAEGVLVNKSGITSRGNMPLIELHPGLINSAVDSSNNFTIISPGPTPTPTPSPSPSPSPSPVPTPAPTSSPSPTPTPTPSPSPTASIFPFALLVGIV